MKVIIAGGRNYGFTIWDTHTLRRLHHEFSFTEVVHGGASGADREGAIWAEGQGIETTAFPADWDKYGKAAGPYRNRSMARYADAVVLFPGGRGTESMRRIANELGLTILYDAEE